MSVAEKTSKQTSATITREEGQRILFGMASMKAALGGVDIQEACFRGRDGVGWVAFLYGAPGWGPPDFRGGWGIAKEKAKRSYEHALNADDPSAERTLAALPMVIVLGKATRLAPIHALEGERVRLELTVLGQHFRVVLVKDGKADNYWLLTGYELRSARARPPVNPRKLTVPSGLHPQDLYGGVPEGERGPAPR